MLKNPFSTTGALIIVTFVLLGASSLFREVAILINHNQLAQVSAPATNPCYFVNTKFFNPGPTTNIVVTSGGQQKTLSIPNQDPPSLLQPIVFSIRYGVNGLPLCNVPIGDMVDEVFLVPNRQIRFAGLPGPMVDSNGFPLSRPGFLEKIYYGGLFHLGGVRAEDMINNEDAVIASIDANRAVTIGASVFLKGGNPNQYHNVFAPATNCARLSGNGPTRIILMRSKDWNSSISDFESLFSR